MSKRVPRLRTDDEAEKFLKKDLSDYIDLKHRVSFKNKAVNKALRNHIDSAIEHGGSYSDDDIAKALAGDTDQ